MREWAPDMRAVDKPLLDVVLRPLMEDGRLDTALQLAVAALRAGVQVNPAAVAALRDAAQEAGRDAALAELDAVVHSSAPARGRAAVPADPDFRFKSKWVLRALRHARPAVPSLS